MGLVGHGPVKLRLTWHSLSLSGAGPYVVFVRRCVAVCVAACGAVCVAVCVAVRVAVRVAVCVRNYV